MGLVTLADVFSTCTATQVFLLGQVAAAHSSRRFVRNKLKQADKDLAAVKAATPVIMSDDYESYYEEKKAVAMAERNAAFHNQISFEKYYKKLCHEYLENGGSQDTLSAMLRILQKEQFAKSQARQPHSETLTR